jgi:hypothetical protein
VKEVIKEHCSAAEQSEAAAQTEPVLPIRERLKKNGRCATNRLRAPAATSES